MNTEKIKTFFAKVGKFFKTCYKMLTGFGKGVKATLESIFIILVLLVLGYGLVSVSGLKETFFPSKGELYQDISQAVFDVLDDAELQTMKATYEGVAEYRDEKGKLCYYVRYNADVTGGIPFDLITFETDPETKTIIVHMPEPELTVNITDKEYMFYKKGYNNKSLETQANKLCIEEVEETVYESSDLISYTKENAERVLTALTKPYLDQENYTGYTLTFAWNDTRQEDTK